MRFTERRSTSYDVRFCAYDSNSAPLHPNRPESKTIDDLYDKFGPTPRICIVKPQEDPGMEKYNEDIRCALENLTLQSLRELSRTTQTLKMDKFSHKLCLISREELHDVRSWFIVTPITNHMQSRLAIRMRTQDIQRQLEMYEDFGYYPISRGLSGILFENLGHLHFQKRIIIEYALMARLSRDNQTNLPQGHSSNPVHNEENTELEELHQAAWDGHRATLDVSPADTHEYGDWEFREFDPQPDIYYIPNRKNEEALDSFIWHDDLLFIFQFTVSEQHNIKTGFISRFTASNRFPQPSNWRFIFIIPNESDQILKSRYLQIPEISNFNPFSAKVAMEGYAKLTESTASNPRRRSIEEGEEGVRPKKTGLRSADGGTTKQKGNAKGKGKVWGLTFRCGLLRRWR